VVLVRHFIDKWKEGLGQFWIWCIRFDWVEQAFRPASSGGD